MKKVIFRKSPDVVSRTVAGERLLVPVRRGVARMDFLFTTNEVGGRVFELLDGQRDVEQVAGLLCREFEGADEERALADVTVFLHLMKDAGLVQADDEKLP